MKQLLSIVIILSFLLQGCSAMFNGGTKQSVYVESNPSGAKVYYHKPSGKDKEEVIESGVTPVVVNVKKKKAGTIEIQKEGYQVMTVDLQKKVTGAFYSNFFWLLLWPVFPIAIGYDAISGSMYRIVPDRVHGDLEVVK
jgi:uncharacterized protein YcfL